MRVSVLIEVSNHFFYIIACVRTSPPPPPLLLLRKKSRTEIIFEERGRGRLYTDYIYHYYTKTESMLLKLCKLYFLFKDEDLKINGRATIAALPSR